MDHKQGIAIAITAKIPENDLAEKVGLQRAKVRWTLTLSNPSRELGQNAQLAHRSQPRACLECA